VQFDIDQRYPAPVAAVLAAYTDRSLYEGLVAGSRVGKPEVLDVVGDAATAVVRLRYRFTADLPAAAMAILDPARLTWVEETRYDLGRATSTTVLRPDHYGDRLAASATARFDPDPAQPDGCRRRIMGEVVVRGVPLGGGRVERAIVDGLREHLTDEAAAVRRHLEATTP
jgi:hypothetical protein